MKIKLKHVREYDHGKVGPESFTSGSATLSHESGRLIGDLALLTRPFGDIECFVDFDEIERLANEALSLVIERMDWMIDQLGIAESVTGELRWFPWFDDNGGHLRKPTRIEVMCLEGESRILWDAIEKKGIPASDSVRLLAAFGVFCCERALDAETRKHIGTIIEMYSAAGVLLGSANYLVGCMTEGRLGDERSRNAMRERGRRKWESHPTQKVKAEIHAEWKRWQMNRSLYKKPSDFRAKMLVLHGGSIPEGTLKNWMTAWMKEWKPSLS